MHVAIVADVEGGHFVGEVTDRDPQGVVVAEVGDVDSHGSAGVTAHVEGNAGECGSFNEHPVALIVKEKVLHRVVGHDDIDPAIVIEVRKGYAQ